MNGLRTTMTPKLGDAESAAAFLCDQWGITDLKRGADGFWETMPEPNSWGIEPQPMHISDADLMAWAAHEGWRR